MPFTLSREKLQVQFQDVKMSKLGYKNEFPAIIIIIIIIIKGNA